MIPRPSGDISGQCTTPPFVCRVWRLAAAFILAVCAGHATARPPETRVAQTAERPELYARLPVPDEVLTRNSTDYYGIYEKQYGSKIGWMRATQRPGKWSGGPWDGVPTIQFENESKFEFREDGVRVVNRLVETYIFENRPPYVLLKATYDEALKNYTKRCTLRRIQGTEYRAEIVQSNETRFKPLTIDFALPDMTSPEAWALAEERRQGDSFPARALDLKDLLVYTDQYKWLKREGQTREQSIWTVECYDTKDQYSTVFHYDAHGKLRSAVVADTTDLRLEPKELAQRIDNPRDIYADSLVKCVSKLTPGDNNRKVAYLELVIEGKDVSGIPNTANQEVKLMPGNAMARIRVGSPNGGPCVGTPVTASEAECQENLAETPDLPLNDKRVKEAARKAVGDAKSTEQKVKNILRYVVDFVIDDYSAEPLSLLDLIKLRRGDCTEHAMLFTALCRASGIPCREATGYLYMGDKKRSFGGHAWCEVALDGKWWPVDPTWDEYQFNSEKRHDRQFDATHIQLSSGKATMRDSRFLSGGITIRVEKVEFTGPPPEKARPPAARVLSDDPEKSKPGRTPAPARRPGL